MADADSTPSNETTVGTIGVGADAYNRATLLLGRVHGLLDFMFLWACSADGVQENLCQDTMSSVLDSAMEQVAEARELLVNGLQGTKEAAHV